MRILVAAALAGFPVALCAQPSTASPEPPPQVLVRSADAARAVSMQVELRGALFAGLGPARGPDGRRVGEVRMAGAGGTATTPAALELSAEAGAVTFRAPADGPAIELTLLGTGATARGRVVRVVRDGATQQLRVEASSPSQK